MDANDMRRQFRRAVEYIIDNNIHFYVAFIFNLLGSELLMRLFQDAESNNARQYEGAIQLFDNGRLYVGRDQVLEYVAERIAQTFPTWLGRLVQLFTAFGVANLMVLLGEIIFDMFFDDDDDDEFIPLPPLPPPPPPPPPGTPPGGPRIPQAEGGRRGGMRMRDPKNTPEPDWVKEILQE